MGRVEHVAVHQCDLRREHGVADLLPVQVQLMVPQRRHVDRCPHGGRRQVERLPEERGDRFAVRLRLVLDDPLGRPVFRPKQSHGPECGRRPRGRPVLLVPDPHLPMTFHPGAERLAGVLEPDRLAGEHLCAIPQVALVLVQRLEAGGDQHLVRLLAQAARRWVVRFQPPRQARRALVDAGRILAVLAPQADRHQLPFRTQRHVDEQEGHDGCCCCSCHVCLSHCRCLVFAAETISLTRITWPSSPKYLRLMRCRAGCPRRRPPPGLFIDFRRGDSSAWLARFCRFAVRCAAG